MKKKLIELMYIIISCFFWLITGAGLFFRKSSIVLCYHGVNSNQKDKFEKQIKLIKQVIGRRKLGVDSIKITFDDGFKNLLDNALPVLKEADLSSAVFVVPGNYGEAPNWQIDIEHVEYNEVLMDSSEIKRIEADGLVTIGSHTYNHSKLAELSHEEMKFELEESKKSIEELIGKDVVELALPHGSYNKDVVATAVELGYEKVYTLEHRLNGFNDEAVLSGRFVVVPETSLIKLYLICCGLYFWLYYFRKAVRNIKG